MRVLALSTSYPKHSADSTAPFVRAISHGLCRHGLEVHLLVPHHPDFDWEAGDPPVHLHTFSYAPRGWRRLHVWGYAGALVADKTLRPETIAVLPFAAASARRSLVHVARRIEPHVLHAHWLLPNAPIAASVAGRLGKPLIISLHGSGAFMAERHPILGRSAGFALRRASHVTACSRDLASRAVRLGAPEELVTAIPYGVEAAAFAPATEDLRARARLELDVAADTFVILAVGRLVAKKGFEFLVKSLESLRDSGTQPLLVIAGEGDLGDRLRAVASKSGVADLVVFLGSVDRERIGRLFAAADVLAVPSIHDDAGNVDGLPNVVLEGLASALPVVASGIAGIPDVIRNEQNGLLVPEKDSGALSTALRRLAVDRELRHRLGATARRVVEESLDWDTITARYARVLTEAVEAEQST